MNNFLYAMTESFKSMQEEIQEIEWRELSEEIHRALGTSNFTEVVNKKLFLSVGTCLHSILDYADRVKRKMKK